MDDHDRARLRTTIEQTRRHWADRLIELATAAYRARDYERSTELLTRALALDPGQADRIEAAGARIAARSGTEGRSIASRLSLQLQTACRLAVAGITDDDRAIQSVLNWNADVATRHG